MNLNGWKRNVGDWARAYKSKKEIKPEFLFAHLHEEVSESWKEWREGRIEQYVDTVKKHGVKLDKPEGLPAELADVIGTALIIADLFDIDMDQAMFDKFEYLQTRLAAKKGKKK